MEAWSRVDLGKIFHRIIVLESLREELFDVLQIFDLRSYLNW